MTARNSILSIRALANLNVTELAGNEGDLWIGTQDQGVVHWQAGRAETFGEAQGMPDPQVFSIALQNDKAYIGTPVGIAEFDSGHFVHVLAPGFFAGTLYADGTQVLAGGSGEAIEEIDSQPQRTSSVTRLPARGVANVQQILGQGESLYAVTRPGQESAERSATPRPQRITLLVSLRLGIDLFDRLSASASQNLRTIGIKCASKESRRQNVDENVHCANSAREYHAVSEYTLSFCNAIRRPVDQACPALHRRFPRGGPAVNDALILRGDTQDPPSLPASSVTFRFARAGWKELSFRPS